MEKLCTNKNHSYKHNEQINKQNIDNSECFGVKYVKIYKVLVKLLQHVRTNGDTLLHVVLYKHFSFK
jgi:hypothetical protein